MRLLNTCSLIIFYLISNGQGFIQVDMYPFKPRVINHDVHFNSEGHITLLSTYIDSFNIYAIQISILDTFSNTLNKYRIIADQGNDFIVRETNAIVCDKQDNCYFYVNLFTGRKCVLLKFDNKFNHINSVQYTWQTDLLTKLSCTYDSNNNTRIICSASQKSNGLDDFLIEVLDTNNQVISQKYYGKEFFSEYLSGFIPLPKNEFMLFGLQAPQTNSSTPSKSNKSWYYLVKIDSLGNLLQEIKGKGTKDSNPSNGVYYRNDNGEFRIAFGSASWDVNTEFNAFVTSPRFIILDSLGEIISEYNFNNFNSNYNYITKVKKIDDGFIVAGQMSSENETQEGFVNIFICKFDHQAKLVWQENIPIKSENNIDNWYSFLTGLDIMPSGSILATGYGENNKNEYCSFLIKLDKNGCLEPGCRSVNVKNEVIDEIIIYPNPSTGSFVVECPDSATLSIYYISGVKIMQKSLDKGKNDITLSEKHKGVFIAKITCNNGISVHKLVVE